MRFWVRGYWSYRSMLLVAGCAVAVGLWARINNPGSPSSRVFDETCFSTFVYNYLQASLFSTYILHLVRSPWPL